MIGIPEKVVQLLKEVAEAENMSKYRFEWIEADGNSISLFNPPKSVKIIGEKVSKNGASESCELNLVCKIAAGELPERDRYRIKATFERESFFYEKVVPAFINFQRDRGLTESEMCSKFPKCYKTLCDYEAETFVIIMEDLRPKGFEMDTERSGVEVVRLVLRELARFHAVSFAMRDRCPEEFELFENVDDLWPNNINTGTLNVIYRQSYLKAAKIFEKAENGACADIYRSMLSNYEKYTASWSDDTVPKIFRALCHGDIHPGNMLFNKVSARGAFECLHRLMDSLSSFAEHRSGGAGVDRLAAAAARFPSDGPVLLPLPKRRQEPAGLRIRQLPAVLLRAAVLEHSQDGRRPRSLVQFREFPAGIQALRQFRVYGPAGVPDFQDSFRRRAGRSGEKGPSSASGRNGSAERRN